MILKAIQRHSSAPDWYAAQLSNAIIHTSSIEEAITLADIMFEDNPEPPETSDEHERSALEDLAHRLSNLSAPFSIDVALGETDSRGVEHRGKGDPRGGQFVSHGGDDAPGASPELDPNRPFPDFSDHDAVELVDEPSSEGADGADTPPDEEEPLMAEIVGAEEYNVDLSPEELSSFQALISHYPKEQQDIANRMLLGKAVDYGSLDGGCNEGTVLLSLEDGTRGVFKPANGEAPNLRSSIPQGTYYKREIATSLVAHILGFGDLVPVTIPRPRSDSYGSMQAFIDNAQTAYKYGDGINTDMDYGSDEDVARAALFDYIIGNTDRHTGNWMIQSPEIAAYKPPQPLDPLAQPEEDLGNVMELGGSDSEEPIEVEEIDLGSLHAEPKSRRDSSDEDQVPDTGEGAPVVDVPPGGVDLPGQKDYSKNKMVLIDNGLSFPTRHAPQDFSNVRMMLRGVKKNLPMPDVSHMQEAWPQVEAALKQAGLEPAAIDRTKQRFHWAVSGEAKTIGDLRNPFSSFNRQKTLRDHYIYHGYVIDPVKSMKQVKDSEGERAANLYDQHENIPSHIFQEAMNKVEKFINNHGSDVFDDEIYNIIKNTYGAHEYRPDPADIWNRIKNFEG